jgi:ribosome-interacting GTPase 1
MCTIEQVDRLAHYDHSLVISLRLNLGLGIFFSPSLLIDADYLLECMWEHLGLVRVFTKKKGHQPSFDEPLVLTGTYDLILP